MGITSWLPKQKRKKAYKILNLIDRRLIIGPTYSPILISSYLLTNYYIHFLICCATENVHALQHVHKWNISLFLIFVLWLSLCLPTHNQPKHTHAHTKGLKILITNLSQEKKEHRVNINRLKVKGRICKNTETCRLS